MGGIHGRVGSGVRDFLENAERLEDHPRFRWVRRWCATSLILVAALAAACGGQPGVIPIASLRAGPTAYSGKMVTAEGVVQGGSFVGDAPACGYDIADLSGHYVDVLPCSRFAADVGRRVEVTGLFRFYPSDADLDGGVVLNATKVVLLAG